MDQPLTPPLTFDNPATYRIRVGGRIAPSRVEWFQGMSVRALAPDDEPDSTQLEGELRDQAALAGVLTTLYEMHLPLLSVECLSAGWPTPGLS